MFSDKTKTDQALAGTKKMLPEPLVHHSRPLYHWLLAVLADFWYGHPSKSMKVIGITGTKGKSTTSYMMAKIFEEQGKSVAMIGSLGYKIKEKEWPNTLKMTMPGRFKLQKFLSIAKKAGCEYAIIEVTSEGIAQKRLVGIDVDCAVFTNLHKEHLESHGGFDNYKEAKKQLFKRTKNIHVINRDSEHAEEFLKIPSKAKITFGMQAGDINQATQGLQLQLAGEFNIYNALAALGVAQMYGLDLEKAKASIASIDRISGRMEYVEQGQPFEVVVDYAHTPESLEGVYQTLKPAQGKLICVLGAAGGGRDAWKRPVFGEIAARYCDEIILTNEDPYDEDPQKIIEGIEKGMNNSQKLMRKVIDRGEAIAAAIGDAAAGDTVVITGKGSETSIALADGKRLPWSDLAVVEELLKQRQP